MKIHRRTVWAISASVLVLSHSALAEDAIDLPLARSYFEEARALSLRDAQTLWGRQLYGPMLLVDKATRTVVANEQVPEATLRNVRGVYVGKLPADVTVANTATNWAGKRWTMLLWPLPSDRRERACLMAHELWHRIQNELGFSLGNPRNAHLDSLSGRVWIRLEWRALARSLKAYGMERTEAARDAISFREYRRSLFPDAAEEERALENNEGLAEFTGVEIAGFDAQARVARLLRKVEEFEKSDSISWSFAYLSGPLYGSLLAAASPGWQRGFLVGDDLGSRLVSELKIQLPRDLKTAVDERMSRYGGVDVRDDENKREEDRQAALSEARANYITGPTLRIPLRQMQIEFNPNNVVTLSDVGTIYPTLKIMDKWGTLETQVGALVSADWTWVVVPVGGAWNGSPSAEGLSWNLEMAPGWAIERRAEGKNWRLRQR